MDTYQSYQTVKEVCGSAFLLALVFLSFGMRSSKRVSATTPPPKPPHNPSDD